MVKALAISIDLQVKGYLNCILSGHVEVILLSPDISSEVLMVEVIKSNVSQPKILWSNWV